MKTREDVEQKIIDLLNEYEKHIKEKSYNFASFAGAKIDILQWVLSDDQKRT